MGVYAGWQVQQRENFLLKIREQGEMAIGMSTYGDEVHENILERLQHRFRGGTIGGPRMVASMRSTQLFILLGQMAASDIFQQGQYAQTDREQACQSSGAPVIF